MSNALPRPSLVFSNITNDLLKERADFIIDQTKGLLDAVSAMEDNTQNFENTFLKIAHLEGSLSPVESIVDFQQYVSTDPEIRKTSSEASSKLQSFGVECSMRRDVYKSLKQVKQEEIDALPATSQRLVKFALRDFERNGLGLPDDQYEQLKAIKQEISALCIKFQQHLNEENTKVNFSKDELKGVPESFFAGREQAEDGKYVVTLKYPDLFPILNNCEIPATRRTLYQVNSRVLVDENVPILENVLSLRQKAAKLLGYRSHSDYILETRMAKNLETVSAFLLNLSTKLEAKAKSEIQVLLDLKIQEAKELNLEIEEGIQPYDFRYFHEKNLRDNYKVDHEKIKEYFPLSKVLSGMLDVYQDLFSVKFLQVPEPDVWHPDVELYAVFDKASEELLGHFYLDLFPREGKFGHAAAFPLQQRFKKEDGAIQHPVAAMVTNFTKPAGDLPSLLLFSEVETLFHEFGHIMHNICTKSEFARFSGTQVERDFVEAPSQMLENWCYEASVLQRMSGHYSNLDQSLPDELLRSLVDAKNCDSGLLNRRQIFFATYDVTVHSSQDEKIETRDLWHKLRKEITLIPEDAGSQPVATFGHIVGGYDSQYYGYLYSEVFSADMFQFFKDNGGVMSPDLGRKYRDLILATGGSRDSIDCLKEFLGREPQDDAFLRHIGI